MGRISTFGQHLYSGRISFDFVGRRKLWYTISALIVVLCAIAFVVRGFNMGIEFKGGVEFTAQVQTGRHQRRRRHDHGGRGVRRHGGRRPHRQHVRQQHRAHPDPGAHARTRPPRSRSRSPRPGATEVSQNLIGPSWGKQVGQKALTGLLVFLVLVVLFIWAYFREWRMSVAALVALAHDLLITAGVYAWSGFEVTPATVTGLLTILGYSLYDTVVVFDKVRENTRGVLRSSTRTYAERANLAVNQTLVRSINTSITALLPVAALLLVGAAVLGTGPLKDLALALFVGMAAGTYSSICIATPLAVQLKDREPAIKAHTGPRPGQARPRTRRSRRPTTASRPNRSRVTAPPAPPRPVVSSGSAKRNQPTRTTRAKRPKGQR